MSLMNIKGRSGTIGTRAGRGYLTSLVTEHSRGAYPLVAVVYTSGDHVPAGSSFKLGVNMVGGASALMKEVFESATPIEVEITSTGRVKRVRPTGAQDIGEVLSARGLPYNPIKDQPDGKGGLREREVLDLRFATTAGDDVRLTREGQGFLKNLGEATDDARRGTILAHMGRLFPNHLGFEVEDEPFSMTGLTPEGTALCVAVELALGVGTPEETPGETPVPAGEYGTDEEDEEA